MTVPPTRPHPAWAAQLSHRTSDGPAGPRCVSTVLPACSRSTSGELAPHRHPTPVAPPARFHHTSAARPTSAMPPAHLRYTREAA